MNKCGWTDIKIQKDIKYYGETLSECDKLFLKQ